MDILQMFSAVLGTGYLINKQLLQTKNEGDEQLDASTDVNTNIPETDKSVPTIPQYTVNREVAVSDPNQPIELQGQVYRDRENTLFHNVPALPSGNKPFLPTLRQTFFMHNHETPDYREPELGNIRWTTKPTDTRVSNILKRYEPNRKDFQDANGNFVNTTSTGVDVVPRASGQEGYLLSTFRHKEYLEKYQPNTIRKTQIDGRNMAVPKLAFGGGGVLPRMDGAAMAYDSHRKNVDKARYPNLSAQVQYSITDRAQENDMRLGKDTTVQGRTPAIVGIGKPTRPYVADIGVSQKEDRVLPGRQPGIHSNIYNEPNNAHRSEQSDSKRKDFATDPFGIARIPSSWVRRQSNRYEQNTTTVDREFEYPNRMKIKPFKPVICGAPRNTLSGKDVPPMAYYPVLTDYMWDRSLKPYQRGGALKDFGPSVGLHPTVNLTFEESQAVRAC